MPSTIMNLAKLVLLGATAVGCASSMAMVRSSYKDTSILQIGAERTEVIERLGQPDVSANLKQGGYIDIYRIDPNAHSDSAKRAAGVSHALLTVTTFGLWELIGTPFEMAVKDRLHTYVLEYDGTEKLVQLGIVEVWNPPTITESDRKKCEQLSALKTMDVAVSPNIYDDTASIIRSYFATNKEREQVYYRIMHQCLLRAYVHLRG